MSALVTLDALKSHLRMDNADEDAELELKSEQATEIVVDYLKKPDHGWTAETAPAGVRAAILLVAGALYVHREGQEDPLSDAVRSLLHRYRDPAFA